MIRVIVFLTFSLFTLGYVSINPDKPIASVTVADTVRVEVCLVSDSLGLPDRYSAHVVTPVCETDKCYIIEIYLSWDLIGRFIRYDTVSGQGLTKLDHVPFTNEDYLKLQEILSNRSSLLSAYSKDELVKNTRSSELDGFTGATIREIKDAVINGAVYSCYTLWHIANGVVIDSLQKTTTGMFTRDLVQKMVDQHDQEVNYFLIDNFSNKDFRSYLPDVLESIQYGEGYYVKNAIERLPEELFREVLVQDYFTTSFDKLDYFAQVALLKKLQSIPLSESLKSILQMQVTERNSYKNDLIISLLNEN